MCISTVCYHCVENESLKEFIKRNANYKYCESCGRKSNRNIAISFEDFAENIDESLKSEFIDPGDLLASDDEDGWDNCIDSSDMFIDDIADIQSNSDTLSEALKDYFIDRQWIRESDYYPTYSDSLLLSWNYYADIVKTKWRYTFFFEKPSEYEPSMLDAQNTFDEIWKLIKSNDLIIELKKGTVVYRSRVHYKKEMIKQAKDIGTPLSKYVKSGSRLSPIGIPLFYGSFDKATAVAEMKKDKRKKFYSIGKFVTVKSINVIDLSNYLGEPGYFSDDKKNIEPVKFLNEFIDLISKPIDDEIDFLEYIPTQVFTEYLRHMAKSNDNIKGIIYKSSKSDTNNIALFYQNSECRDKAGSASKDDYLLLVSIEKCIPIS